MPALSSRALDHAAGGIRMLRIFKPAATPQRDPLCQPASWCIAASGPSERASLVAGDERPSPHGGWPALPPVRIGIGTNHEAA